MTDMVERVENIIKKLDNPHNHRIFVGYHYSKKDLVRDLEALKDAKLKAHQNEGGDKPSDHAYINGVRAWKDMRRT